MTSVETDIPSTRVAREEATSNGNNKHPFADTIENVYRVAISNDPSPRNRIAYACYLAEHSQTFEAIVEFENLLDLESVENDPGILREIVQHLVRIANRSGDDLSLQCSDFSWQDCMVDSERDDAEELNGTGDDYLGGYFNLASEFADVAYQLVGGDDGFRDLLGGIETSLMKELSEVIQSLRRHRERRERRGACLAFLRLATICESRDWRQIEVECIRRGVRCLQPRATSEAPIARFHRCYVGPLDLNGRF